MIVVPLSGGLSDLIVKVPHCFLSVRTDWKTICEDMEQIQCVCVHVCLSVCVCLCRMSQMVLYLSRRFSEQKKEVRTAHA